MIAKWSKPLFRCMPPPQRQSYHVWLSVPKLSADGRWLPAHAKTSRKHGRCCCHGSSRSTRYFAWRLRRVHGPLPWFSPCDCECQNQLLRRRMSLRPLLDVERGDLCRSVDRRPLGLAHVSVHAAPCLDHSRDRGPTARGDPGGQRPRPSCRGTRVSTGPRRWPGAVPRTCDREQRLPRYPSPNPGR